MAGLSASDPPFTSDVYLSPDQRDLLIAALSSHGSKSDNHTPSQQNQMPRSIKRSDSDPQNEHAQTIHSNDSEEHELLDGGTDDNLDFKSFLDNPFDDFLDVDGNFELDVPEDHTVGDQEGAAAPRPGLNGYLHEKRKSSDDVNDVDEAEHDDKRREGDDKSAKKPGRKPITAEPTTKRKAQNRAAQRAFRERKEKHLKDLETKVSDLEKTSESTNHENGLLRAQVERLQTELRDYRKRLSMNNNAANRSPTRSMAVASNLTTFKPLTPNVDDFQFNFPKFGDTAFPIFGNVPVTFTPRTSLDATGVEVGPQASRSSISSQALASVDRAHSGNTSPKNANNLFSNQSPNGQVAGNAGLQTTSTATSEAQTRTDLFSSPFLFNDVATSPIFGYDLPTTGSFNSINQPSPSEQQAQQKAQDQRSRGSTDSYSSGANRSPFSTLSGGFDSASPSCPSLSQGATPEASHQSPPTRNSLGTIDENINRSAISKVPMPMEFQANNLTGFDWLSNQNGGQFDPTLFGGYRESQDAIVGDGDFAGGFFNEFPLEDWGTPLEFNDNLNNLPASKLIEQVDRQQNGNYRDVLEGDNTISKKQVTSSNVSAAKTQDQECNTNKLWLQIQARKDFQDGTLDIDSLCSEMKLKARCSETGAVINRNDVDDIFKRASKVKTAAGGRTSCG